MRFPISAYHASILAVLGDASGQVFANATVADNPSRLVSEQEGAALVAWAMTGVQTAGWLALKAIEVATPSGRPMIYTGDGMVPMAEGIFGKNFGEYVVRALNVGAGLAPDPLGRQETVAIALHDKGLGISVLVSGAGQTVAAHYGVARGQPVNVGQAPPNAVRHIAAMLPAAVPLGENPFASVIRSQEEDAGEYLQ